MERVAATKRREILFFDETSKGAADVGLQQPRHRAGFKIRAASARTPSFLSRMKCTARG